MSFAAPSDMLGGPDSVDFVRGDARFAGAVGRVRVGIETFLRRLRGDDFSDLEECRRECSRVVTAARRRVA
jgi:hypothetical protein